MHWNSNHFWDLTRCKAEPFQRVTNICVISSQKKIRFLLLIIFFNKLGIFRILLTLFFYSDSLIL